MGLGPPFACFSPPGFHAAIFFRVTHDGLSERGTTRSLGRINIVKTIGISKLIYSASVLPVPDHYVQEINKLIFNLIWAGKPPKIKRNTIIGEKKTGGLKMCDLKIMEKALKITWVNRIQDESPASWKIIPNQLLHKHGGLAFLTKCYSTTSILDLDDKLPTFYKKMLDYWFEFKISSGIDPKTNPKNEILWNNRKILVGKKTVFYNNWYDAGITKISDLLNQNQDFLKWHELAITFNLKVPFTTYSTDQKKPNRERLTERVLFPFHTRSRSRSVSVPFPFCIRSVSVPYPFRSRSVSVQCCSVPALLAFDL